MKSIILIAAPAAGKGTEADMLKEDFNLPHISTGDILRKKSEENSELGKEILDKISNGKFVSDELMISLLKERIQNNDCQQGYILDGFPRNISQALSYEKMLDELSKELGLVIVIDIDKEVAKSRIEGRRTCPNCGKIYNINEIKPKQEGICDNCLTPLMKRKDDNSSTYDERYKTYIEKTAPLIDYYNKKGVLYHVDGSKGKTDTHDQIKKIIAANENK